MRGKKQETEAPKNSFFHLFHSTECLFSTMFLVQTHQNGSGFDPALQNSNIFLKTSNHGEIFSF